MKIRNIFQILSLRGTVEQKGGLIPKIVYDILWMHAC